MLPHWRCLCMVNCRLAGIEAGSLGSAFMPIELARHHAATQRRDQDSGRLVARGIALNLVLAVLKFAGGIWGRKS